jgi:hypothetical protein
MKYREALTAVHLFMRVWTPECEYSAEGSTKQREVYDPFIAACGGRSKYQHNGEPGPGHVMLENPDDPLVQQTLLLRNFTKYIDKE